MRFIFLLVSALALSACMSMANIDYDRSVNFKSFKTFQVQKEPVQVDEDTRVTTPFMQERIVNAINKELALRGLTKQDKQADLVVKYHMSVARDIETESSTVSFGFGTGGHHSHLGMGFIFPVGETYTVDRLVLTIDIYSAKPLKLVWRGSLAYRLDSGATPDSYTYMANRLVDEILKDYPPR